MNTALKLVELTRDDTSLSVRANYQRMLEADLERWVAKCQVAFREAFDLGSSRRFPTWEDAFDYWIRKRGEG